MMRGHELLELLSQRFQEAGVAGYPIFIINKETGSISEITGIFVEYAPAGDPVYTTWVEVEEI